MADNGRMQRGMVIGCGSLELTGDGIKAGALPIAWRDVKAAALAGRDRQMTQMAEAMMVAPQPPLQSARVFFDVMRKAMELRETHDALLIVHRAGIVHALIEQSGPEREALLAGLRTNLGNRWLGEDFTSQQLEERFGPKSSGCSLRTLGCLTVLIGGSLLIMFGSMLMVAVPGAAVSTFAEALLAGEWKAALIAGAALVVLVLLYFGVKKMVGYAITIIRGRLG